MRGNIGFFLYLCAVVLYANGIFVAIFVYFMNTSLNLLQNYSFYFIKQTFSQKKCNFYINLSPNSYL